MKKEKSNSSDMETFVKFFRLNNGEDIIAEVQETDVSYILLNPCKVMYLSSAKPGYLSISFMQWVFSRICDEQVFEIMKTEVLFNAIPSEMMMKHYWDSVEHFMHNEDKQKLSFDNMMSDEEDFSQQDADDAMEMLKEFFNRSKDDKGSLH
jgi:hypothetical protein